MTEPIERLPTEVVSFRLPRVAASALDAYGERLGMSRSTVLRVLVFSLLEREGFIGATHQHAEGLVDLDGSTR